MSAHLSPENPAGNPLRNERGGTTRVLLLLLLLVAAAAGYLYYFTDLLRPMKETAKAPAVQTAQVKKPIPPRSEQSGGGAAVPAKTEGAPPSPAAPAASPAPPQAKGGGEQKPAPPVAPTAKPAAPKVAKAEAPVPAAVPPAKPAAAKAGTAEAPTKSQAAPAAIPAKASPKPAKPGTPEAVSAKAPPAPAKPGTPAAVSAKTPPAPVKPGAPAANKEATPATKVAKKEATPATPVTKVAKPVVSRKGGAYTLQVGDFVPDTSFTEVQAKLKKSGVAPVKKSVVMATKPMNRLFVAQFTDQDAAEAELQKLKKLTGDAFLVADSGTYTLYAGSYFTETRLNAELQRLGVKGIKPVVRKAQVTVKVTRVTAGSYAHAEEARKDALRLKKLGITATVVKPGA